MPTSTNTLVIERLARVEEKIDNFLMRMMDQHDRLDDHDVRLRSLEAGNSKLLGIAAVIVMLVAVFGTQMVETFFQ